MLEDKLHKERICWNQLSDTDKWPERYRIIVKAIGEIYVLLHVGNKKLQIITQRQLVLPAISAAQEESMSIMTSSSIISSNSC